MVTKLSAHARAHVWKQDAWSAFKDHYIFIYWKKSLMCKFNTNFPTVDDTDLK